MRAPAQDDVRRATARPAAATFIEVSTMAQIRLCPCGAPPVHGPWCWACAQEQEKQHRPLGVITWDTADLD
ncbi:hypothetical protein KTU01_03500 [Kocuria turfanensis]|uniref:Uncharacterized protein n=1 Tax=Kocuria turfanensis TaxID=388357 RepID=A0A512I995_9MICC|nr:hypothetical protein KTU01_03500 [Kocuria turfanensis]